MAAACPAPMRPFDEGPPGPPHRQLRREIEAAANYAYKQTKLFERIHYGMRVGLIVFSVLVSAQGLSFIAKAAPVLALFVAIGTGVDTWLRPGVRYKVHYTYHDHFRRLLTEYTFLTDDGEQIKDPAGLLRLKQQFHQTDDEYRKEIFLV